MKNVYLVFAIVGAVVPYIFFLDFFNTSGFALDGFMAGLFANGAAGGFTADLLITSVVFWIYLWTRNVANMWVYVVLNLTIGLSCALPAYLYMNARQEEAALA